MTRIPVAGLARALVVLAAILFLMAPRWAPMEVTKEHITYGYDADQTDGCMGPDELLDVVAKGNLAPGESYTYSPAEPNCHAFRIITARANPEHGKADLLVSIDSHDTAYSWHEEAFGYVCFKVPSGDGHGMKSWSITVTNAGNRTARDVIFQGSNYDAWFYPGSTCP